MGSLQAALPHVGGPNAGAASPWAQSLPQYPPAGTDLFKNPLPDLVNNECTTAHCVLEHLQWKIQEVTWCCGLVCRWIWIRQPNCSWHGSVSSSDTPFIFTSIYFLRIFTTRSPWLQCGSLCYDMSIHWRNHGLGDLKLRFVCWVAGKMAHQVVSHKVKDSTKGQLMEGLHSIHRLPVVILLVNRIHPYCGWGFVGRNEV